MTSAGTTRRYTVEQVSFVSGGLRCVGALYHPEDGALPQACVVMAHGFSGTSDWIVPDFAATFADNGLAVLLFDYRYLGRSEGEPRQLINGHRQLEDLRRAIEFVRAYPGIDARRIALWGTSLGGSHVISIAAEDPAVAAVVANVPALDVFRGLRGRSAPLGIHPSRLQIAMASAHLLGSAIWDAARGALGLSPHYIAVYGRLGHAIFADPALAPLFDNVEAHSPLWRNRVTPRFFFTAPRYKDGTIARIAAPLLITVARYDATLSTDFVKDKAAEAPSVVIKEYPVGHFDVYHGAVRDQVAADHLKFLKRHLAV